MEFNKLADNLAVSPQITPADIVQIVANGYKTLLCNRPDGEAEDQADYRVIEEAAREAGLEVIFQPVSPKQVTAENVEDFTGVVKNANGPVLAYCRTGTRCAMLWALGESISGVGIDDIVKTAASAGYDFSKQAAYIGSAAPR